jgi:hypothetical protein
LARIDPARSGFPLAGARFVEPLGRGTTTTIAFLLPDRLAIGETEAVQSGIISVGYCGWAVGAAAGVSGSGAACDRSACRRSRRDWEVCGSGEGISTVLGAAPGAAW